MSCNPVIISVADLESIVASAKIHQDHADKYWTTASKACVVEILYRKQCKLLERLTSLAKAETIWRHMSRAIMIMLGGTKIDRVNNKIVELFDPILAIAQYAEKQECWAYDKDMTPESVYVETRIAFEKYWKDAPLKAIFAQDPPKKLSTKAWKALFNRFIASPHLWEPSEADEIRLILETMRGIAGTTHEEKHNLPGDPAFRKTKKKISQQQRSKETPETPLETAFFKAERKRNKTTEQYAPESFKLVDPADMSDEHLA